MAHSLEVGNNAILKEGKREDVFAILMSLSGKVVVKVDCKTVKVSQEKDRNELVQLFIK